MNNLRSTFTLAVAVALTSVSCGPKRTPGLNPTDFAKAINLAPGQEVIEWTRPAKAPEWIDVQPSNQDGQYRFIGVVDKATREDFARTDAREAARIALARDINTKVFSTYGFGREGDSERYVIDAAILASRTSIGMANIRGGQEFYTVRYYVQPAKGAPIDRYFYKVYVLMSINSNDLQKAMIGALEDLKKKDPSGKQVLEDFEQKISDGKWVFNR